MKRLKTKFSLRCTSLWVSTSERCLTNLRADFQLPVQNKVLVTRACCWDNGTNVGSNTILLSTLTAFVTAGKRSVFSKVGANILRVFQVQGISAKSHLARTSILRLSPQTLEVYIIYVLTIVASSPVFFNDKHPRPGGGTSSWSYCLLIVTDEMMTLM